MGSAKVYRLEGPPRAAAPEAEGRHRPETVAWNRI
jgi:hypothetical protein